MKWEVGDRLEDGSVRNAGMDYWQQRMKNSCKISGETRERIGEIKEAAAEDQLDSEAGLAPISRGKKVLENVPSACLVASEHKRISITLSTTDFVFPFWFTRERQMAAFAFLSRRYSIVTLRSRLMLQTMEPIFFLSICSGHWIYRR